ncbi:MAG: NAD(P)-dependent oxidoreductase [Endozoicomonas sp.]
MNTARGGLVNEASLVKGLHAGEIGGTGFDVLT